MTPVGWALTFAATYRATLLVTADEITRPLRDRVTARNPDGWLARLIDCPWCVSMWVAVPVVLSGLLWHRRRTWQAITGILAASAVTGVAASYARPD